MLEGLSSLCCFTFVACRELRFTLFGFSISENLYTGVFEFFPIYFVRKEVYAYKRLMFYVKSWYVL